MPRKRKAGKLRNTENLEDWGRGGAFSLLGSGYTGGLHRPSEVDPHEEGFDWKTCARAWAYWRERMIEQYSKHRPGSRPWAFWVLDRKMSGPPYPHEAQTAYLRKHGLLTEHERILLDKRQN